MNKKTKDFLKSLVKPFLWIAGIISILFIGKKMLEEAILNKVEKPTNWHTITPTTISVFDKYVNMYRRVKLPIDRRTDKRIKPKQIEAVGISSKGGKINVQIKHEVVDRSIPIDSGNSTSTD